MIVWIFVFIILMLLAYGLMIRAIYRGSDRAVWVVIFTLPVIAVAVFLIGALR